MPLYRYVSIGVNGKKGTQVVDAESLEAAKNRLLKEGVFVTKIAPLLKKRKSNGQLTAKELLEFTRDLHSLLKAGLPLYESLVTIEETYRHHKAHALFLDLCDKVKQGHPLSSILKEYPKSFSHLYISMVQAGEESGALDTAFHSLSSLIARQQKLKKQTLSALIYPAFLGGFCLIVLVGLLFFLIPSMQELYEGRQLHPLTATVLGLSQGLRAHWVWLLTLLTLTGGSLTYFFKRERGQRVLKQLALKVPFLKTLIVESVLIRFCRSLSVLLEASVPYLKALALSRKVMHHVLFEEVILKAEEGIVQGRKVSQELEKHALIPPLVTRMLAMAEETGRSGPMLASISTIYEDDLEKNLSRFTALLQPIILLFLGVIVAVILLAVLLPLTDVNSLTM